MNKTKVTCHKKIIETFDIQYKSVDGLKASVVVSTTYDPKSKEPVVKLDSTFFNYNSYGAYILSDDVVSKHIASYDGDIGMNFHYDYIAPNINVYTVDEAKNIDVDSLYVIHNNNIFQASTQKNCTSKFLFSDNDMSSELSHSIYMHAKKIGLKVEVYKMFFDHVTKFIVYIDNKMFDSVYFDIDGFECFYINGAMDILIRSYMESGDE